MNCAAVDVFCVDDEPPVACPPPLPGFEPPLSPDEELSAPGAHAPAKRAVARTVSETRADDFMVDPLR
jgi:hypothetical protein